MRKIIARVMLFFIMLSSISFTDQGLPPDKITDMTTDETIFSAQLNDRNKSIFAHMNAKQRAECMQMTALYNDTGNILVPNRVDLDVLTPDASVEKVNSTLTNQE